LRRRPSTGASRIALGPRRGAKVARYGSPPEEVMPVALGPCHAALDGFDLHAGVVVRAGERERLERLCRPRRADDGCHIDPSADAVC
jgi:hypothetical protein